MWTFYRGKVPKRKCLFQSTEKGQRQHQKHAHIRQVFYSGDQQAQSRFLLLSSVQTPSESVKQRDYQKYCKHACSHVNTQQSDDQFMIILIRGVGQFRRVTTEPRPTHFVGVFTEGVVLPLLKDK